MNDSIDATRLRALMETLVNRAKGYRDERCNYSRQRRPETKAYFHGKYSEALSAIDEIGQLLTPRMCVEVSENDIILREYKP